ncbi:MAG: aminotransferase class I/II-fold pyridoxal phosphate-dependent enzyme [Gammaproteobacteria bacterium]|jgi:threonine aldolase|nr:aminotransferase class I/II-fold pyridoxal phosphate-dependent enzyme [Gammaproteobacteria bacterium]
MFKIDLRSDTFTMPDKGMRRAIYEAEVGNSGYAEDPSVNQLETEIAEYFGVEAGIFLPSATMAGQIAIRAWSRPGDVVLIEEFGHNYYFETGSMSLIAGVQARLLQGLHGILAPETIEASIVHPENPYARTSLIVLENTSNFGGGTIYPQETLETIFALTANSNLPVQIDGARIWNAIVAADRDPKQLIQPGGSMSVCFSKGLGAPMGALLLGSLEYINEARRIQSMLGGVMRQVGFMAAAALYGFRHNMERLEEDHANCSFIANRLADLSALEIDLQRVQTNILYFNVKAGTERASRLVDELAENDVGALNVGSLVRLVTSKDVSRKDCEYAVEAIHRLLK